MSLAEEYKRQFDWRAWSSIFDTLPSLHGKTILDLGCGVGDQAAELAARGARVIGVDRSETFLQEARARQLPDAEFRTGDLRTFTDLNMAVDGIWCSFAAAYCEDLPSALAAWSTHLRPGGWVALTEIDDLFGHGPLSPQTKALFEDFARDVLTHGYDVHMGRKLRSSVEQSGLKVQKVLVVPDLELSSDGPARPEVVEAWRSRFDRMTLFQDFCGSDFERVRDEFLDCLLDAGHRSVAKVYCCIATKPPAA